MDSGLGNSAENTIQDLAGVFERRPKWVSRAISETEGRCLAKTLEEYNCVRGLEIGSASGFSGSVFYSQLYANDRDNAVLRCFDLSERCYYDDEYQTGDALWQIHGRDANVVYTYGVTSADINDVEDVRDGYDFLFIDANHRNPWPALDLLSLSRFLKKNAVVGLDDINMSYNKKFRDCNGAQHLYRCWFGEKWRYRNASNVGILILDDMKTVMESVLAALSVDWDMKVADELLVKYMGIVAEIDSSMTAQFEKVIGNKKMLRRSLKA